MNEFEQELDKIFVKLGIDAMQAKPLAIEAIKQAVAKHIIGEDEGMAYYELDFGAARDDLREEQLSKLNLN